MASRPKISRKQIDRTPDGAHCVPDPTLTQAGWEIRDVFVATVLARHHRTVRYGQDRDWLWYRAAEIARRHKLSPEEFVTRQFAEVERHGRVYPEALVSDKVALKASQSLEANDQSRIDHYMCQLGLVEKLTPIHGVKVYRDVFWPLTPVIRFCLALANQDPAVANLWRAQAYVEAAQYPAAMRLIKVYESKT